MSIRIETTHIGVNPVTTDKVDELAPFFVGGLFSFLLVEKEGKALKIIDAHCDVLMKMVEDDRLDFYRGHKQLQVQFSYLEQANVVLQIFALFIPPSIPVTMRFHYALKMIDVFYERIVKPQKLQPVYNALDIEKLFEEKPKYRCGLLSLEGADALQGDIMNLRILYRLGLRALGFTWNHRNEAADGVEEPNPGGLSQFGRELLKEANRLRMVLDVSHLSEQGFWDVIALSETPIIASHSNCKGIRDHHRNLSDDQMKAIFQSNGVIGLTFVPSFISGEKRVTISSLLKHLDYVLSLGGEDHLAFGSDFDGITQTMDNLQSTREYVTLVNELLKVYKQESVEKWLNGNWRRIFMEVLG